MGLDDRDYMRDVPIYRRLVGRDDGLPTLSTTTSRGSRARLPAVHSARSAGHISWAWLVLAVLGAATFFFYKVHHVGTAGQPLVPHAAVSLATPTPPAARTFAMTGDTTAAAGSSVTATGTLPPGVSGPVVVTARWGSSGPWYRLATSIAQNGGYRVQYLLSRPGVVHVRIELPDGDAAVGTMTVT